MDPKGAVFPFHVPGGYDEMGLIQRDLVAVAAMHALLSRPDAQQDDEKLLEEAFKIADAFIVRTGKRT